MPRCFHLLIATHDCVKMCGCHKTKQMRLHNKTFLQFTISGVANWDYYDSSLQYISPGFSWPFPWAFPWSLPWPLPWPLPWGWFQWWRVDQRSHGVPLHSHRWVFTVSIWSKGFWRVPQALCRIVSETYAGKLQTTVLVHLLMGI